MFRWRSADGSVELPLRSFRCAVCAGEAWAGAPVCPAHADYEYGVAIAPSAIEGLGLFATSEFRPGDRICPYVGERLTRAELEARYPGDATAPYAVTTAKGVIVDAARLRGLGSFANSGIDPNAVLTDRPELRATRFIASGEEIVLDYGAEYRYDDAVHATQWRPVMEWGRTCCTPPGAF